MMPNTTMAVREMLYTAQSISRIEAVSVVCIGAGANGGILDEVATVPETPF